MDTFPDKLDVSFQWFVIHLNSRLWIILPGSGYMSPKYIMNGHFSTNLLSHVITIAKILGCTETPKKLKIVLDDVIMY
ncbi:unnamed protein product [Lactuca virosa]|uniref:Uncharacterized protein n=1 Tax=Lactuca virosa TaxID=75947 RepID=A0AAU9P2V9_9ASTR|nr:unnamed protein product [Lactuca virosa]